MGYYWPTIVQDCINFARKYDACKFNKNSYISLQNRYASWPFKEWGLEVVGPINPKASNEHMYILAATNYFSNWAEAVTLREVIKENIA